MFGCIYVFFLVDKGFIFDPNPTEIPLIKKQIALNTLAEVSINLYSIFYIHFVLYKHWTKYSGLLSLTDKLSNTFHFVLAIITIVCNVRFTVMIMLKQLYFPPVLFMLCYYM